MTRRTPKMMRRGWRSIVMDLTKAGQIMRDAGVAADGDPVSAKASFDADGRPRRIHARYADGWRVTLNIHCSGGFTVSQTITMRIEGQKS